MGRSHFPKKVERGSLLVLLREGLARVVETVRAQPVRTSDAGLIRVLDSWHRGVIPFYSKMAVGLAGQSVVEETPPTFRSARVLTIPLLPVPPPLLSFLFWHTSSDKAYHLQRHSCSRYGTTTQAKQEKETLFKPT